MYAPDGTGADAAAVARRLAGVELDELNCVRGGRNSRIYYVRCGDAHFALKQYRTQRNQQRDGLGAELAALTLMQRHRIDCVPKVVAVDRAQGCMLMSWIDGSPVDTPGSADVVAANAFLDSIHALARAPEAASLPQAAEACLSAAEIERQIEQRVERLTTAAKQAPELARFLDDDFQPAFDRVTSACRRILHAGGSASERVVPAECRSLIPADFGFHNSIRRPDGTLAFIDFEYFGWDDPVKLTADILLHPGMALSESLRLQFRAGAERRHAGDMGFSARLDALLPLFTLRWTLILLNEFVSERWDERRRAGVSMTWQEAKAEQLARARRMLLRTSDAEVERSK